MDNPLCDINNVIEAGNSPPTRYSPKILRSQGFIPCGGRTSATLSKLYLEGTAAARKTQKSECTRYIISFMPSLPEQLNTIQISTCTRATYTGGKINGDIDATVR
jgi:hypothetical protein